MSVEEENQAHGGEGLVIWTVRDLHPEQGNVTLSSYLHQVTLTSGDLCQEHPVFHWRWVFSFYCLEHLDQKLK